MSFQNKTFKSKCLAMAVVSSLTPAVPVWAQDNNDSENLEEVLVTGIRGSIMQSMDIKRNAGSVVDAITATDIGKLPDATIADSLQRIPGVQIERSGGEGASVNIRGNENVATTLNGEQMLSAGAITTITPDFSDVPATMVSGLEVYKSSQSKNVVSGLAGTINLQTNRPFLLAEGLTAVASIEAAHGSLGGEVDPAFSGFIGYNKGNRLGAFLNVSKSTSYLADYDVGSQGAERGEYGGWSFNASEASNFLVDDIDVNGDGDVNDVYYSFQGHQAANRFIDRDRTGVNGSLQFKPTEALELTADVFYTKMEEHHYFAGLVASQAWQTATGWYTPDADGVTAYDNITGDDFSVNEGNYHTVQSAEMQARAVKTHSQTWALNKEALNTNLELAFDNGGALTGSVRWVHGEGTSDDVRSIVDSFITSGSQIGDQYVPADGDPIDANPWGYDGVPATLPNGSRVPQLDGDGNPVVDDDGNPVYNDPYTMVPIHISYRNGNQNWMLPTLDVVEDDDSVTTEVFGSNLDRYSAKSTNLYGEYTNATLDVLRIDGNFAFDDVAVIQSVDFGARYGVREVKKQGWYGGVARTNEYGDAFLARWKDSATSAPVTGESYIEPISFSALNQQNMIVGIDDFHGATGLGTLYFIDPEAMKDPIAWHEELYGVNVLVPDAANVYTVEEATATLFAQLNLDGELGGMSYRGNIGFRYIETEFDIVQSEALQGQSAVFNGQEFLIGPGIVQPVGAEVSTVNKYSDFLPALNLALDLSDNQILRTSITKTVSTHNTDMLGGGLTVNRTANCDLRDASGARIFCATGGGQQGNPLLEPNRNTNAEISYEWYFSDSSMFSAGAFWIQQNTGFETSLINRDDITDSDGEVRGFDLDSESFLGYVPIQTTTTRQEASYTRGVELNYRQSFDFVEGFWGDFGVDTNYTYSPSTSSDLDFYGEALPGTGNSEHQTNLSLWYEAGGIQARIAHNYRSKMFNGVKYEGDYRFAYWTAPTNYLDASFSYEFSERYKVSLQATNLTEEYIETYHQWETNVDGTYFNERRVTLGFQANL